MTTDLFFIALLPPPDIQEEVTAFKQIAAKQFKAKRALNSPPHITLIPPFRLATSDLQLLLDQLRLFNQQISPFWIQLQDFAAFPPGVIYVDVVPNEELNQCQAQLENQCANLGITSDRRYGFHPHMTVAFKDLKKTIFPSAWAYFQEHSFQRKFAVTKVSLLHWQDGQWHVHQ